MKNKFDNYVYIEKYKCQFKCENKVNKNIYEIMNRNVGKTISTIISISKNNKKIEM